MVRELGR